MARKITGGAPVQERRPAGAHTRTQARCSTDGRRAKAHPVADFIVLTLFALYLAAWVILFCGLCYGVMRGIIALAHEPRGVQVGAALAIVSAFVLAGIAVVARGDQ